MSRVRVRGMGIHSIVTTNRRVAWIDSLKALGILFVYLGHCRIDPGIVKYVFSFHMPLFFLLAGIFFKQEMADQKIRPFLLSRLRLRIIPYISFGMLTYFVWASQGLLKKYKIYQGATPVPENFYKPLIGMLYGNGIGEWLAHNESLWFLACLFATECLMYSILACTKKRANIVFIIFILSIIGNIDSKYSPIRLPFGMDIAFTAVAFYSTGYILKEYLLSFKPNLLIGAMCLFLGFLLSHSNSGVNLSCNSMGNYFLFFSSAFSSIYGYFCIAKLLPHFKIVSIVGQNSLVTFLLEKQAYFAINLVVYFFTWIKLNQIDLSVPLAVAYSLTAIFFTIPVAYLIDWKFPLMIGKLQKQVFISGRLGSLS